MPKLKIAKDDIKNIFNEEKIHIMWEEFSRLLAEKLGCKSINPRSEKFYDVIMNTDDIDKFTNTPLEGIIKNFYDTFPCKWKVSEGICQTEKALCSFTGFEIKKEESVYVISFESNEENYPIKAIGAMSKDEKENEYRRQISLRNEFLIKEHEKKPRLYTDIICNVLHAMDPSSVIDKFMEKIIEMNHSDLNEFIKNVPSNKKIRSLFAKFINIIIIFRKTIIKIIPNG
jgi:hypothetical protein